MQPIKKTIIVPAGYAEEMREAINTQIEKHARVISVSLAGRCRSLLIAATTVWLSTRVQKYCTDIGKG